jgi:hypothetical protein
VKIKRGPPVRPDKTGLPSSARCSPPRRRDGLDRRHAKALRDAGLEVRAVIAS